GNVQLTSSSPANNLWSDNSTTQSITVNSSGNYSVNVTDANGCSATSASTSVSVNPAPPTPTITANGPTTFCQGGSVQLTSSSPANNLWSDNSTLQTITVNSSGSFSVNVTDANGCSATSASTSVTVNPAPPTPTVTANGPTTFCQGGSVQLTSGSPANNLWSDNSTTQSITVNSSGNYSVNVTDANGCSAASSVTIVTVNSAPSVTLGSDTTICTSSQLTLNAGNFSSYQWQDNSTLSTLLVDGNTLGTGTYTFFVNVVDMNGCSASDTAAISITVCTGISDLGMINVNISPNPTEGILNLMIGNFQGNKLDIEIMNAEGQIVYSKKIFSNSDGFSGQLDISTLSKGVYYLKIIDGEKVSFHKIVLQ
ncbi:MAG TPA: T9SS type A sorting domain-containing protein, partial [Bacteroidia bacterium]|nr:T9SS type A sorting domain-containing protein [Bacteroidia bacterium]